MKKVPSVEKDSAILRLRQTPFLPHVCQVTAWRTRASMACVFLTEKISQGCRVRQDQPQELARTFKKTPTDGYHTDRRLKIWV